MKFSSFKIGFPSLIFLFNFFEVSKFSGSIYVCAMIIRTENAFKEICISESASNRCAYSFHPPQTSIRRPSEERARKSFFRLHTKFSLPIFNHIEKSDQLFEMDTDVEGWLAALVLISIALRLKRQGENQIMFTQSGVDFAM